MSSLKHYTASWIETVRARWADRYEPSRYYMRGPGPKCQARAAQSASSGSRA